MTSFTINLDEHEKVALVPAIMVFLQQRIWKERYYAFNITKHIGVGSPVLKEKSRKPPEIILTAVILSSFHRLILHEIYSKWLEKMLQTIFQGDI